MVQGLLYCGKSLTAAVFKQVFPQVFILLSLALENIFMYRIYIYLHPFEQI
jgi:hypothetical protein